MTVTPDLAARFKKWLDAAFSRRIPRKAVAFNFNLYEYEDSFHVDLIGAPSYDPENSGWACNEVFVAREPIFRIPRSAEIKTWRKALTVAVRLVRAYLRQDGPHSRRLKNSCAVTVGFVDGDLVVVWPPAA